jgi:lysophospholipase L1-like esterase
MKLSVSKVNTVTGSVLIVGDSISLGATDVRGNEVLQRVERPYVDVLRQQFPSVEFAVDAEVHRTTIVARQRIATLLAEQQPDVVLLMIGGNDATFDWKRFVVTDGKIARSKVPVERFQENLIDLVRHVRDAGAVPVICDLPVMSIAVRGEYISQLAGKDLAPLLERGGGQAEVDRHHAIYMNAVGAIADHHDVLVARFSEEMYQLGPSHIVSTDGVHPNAKGHEMIAAGVAPVLARALQLSARSRRASVAV